MAAALVIALLFMGVGSTLGGLRTLGRLWVRTGWTIDKAAAMTGGAWRW